MDIIQALEDAMTEKGFPWDDTLYVNSLVVFYLQREGAQTDYIGGRPVKMDDRSPMLHGLTPVTATVHDIVNYSIRMNSKMSLRTTLLELIDNARVLVAEAPSNSYNRLDAARRLADAARMLLSAELQDSKRPTTVDRIEKMEKELAELKKSLRKP